MKTIDIECACRSCEGSGLYVGFGERDGIAVVCSTCKGTGKQILSYVPFTKVQERRGVKRVLQTNPGIQTGGDSLEEFGGITYVAWCNGERFTLGTEMRKYTCPKWWLQSTGENSPNWEECEANVGNGPFSACRCFARKEMCWAKYDLWRKK